MPVTMVVDESDYRSLKSDDSYLDFLLNILRERACLFLGFSFLDPAIDQVLSVYESKCGPAYSSLHRAIIPTDNDKLAEKLRRLNIKVLQYAVGRRHESLWRGVRTVLSKRKVATRATELKPQAIPQSNPAVHRLMAFSYAQVRAKQRREQRPLAELVQDAVVLSLVPTKDSSPILERTLIEGLASIVGIDIEEATAAFKLSIARLLGKEQIIRRANGFVLTQDPGHELDEHLASLATSVSDRILVREGRRLGTKEMQSAKNAIERILLARAWDVTAHYAGADNGWSPDLRGVIKIIAIEECKNSEGFIQRAIGHAIWDLVSAPEKREAELLGKLSRAAFGLQLLLSTPRHVLFHRYSLPEKIYLDANVLMPAIISGHPLSPVYVDCLKRLGDASKRAGIDVQVIVGQQFLNEIVSHKDLAISLVAELGLEDPKSLADYILFYGATNINAYIAAYSAHVGRERKKTLFAGFLKEFAPYGNVKELRTYLFDLGIQTLEYDRKLRLRADTIDFVVRLQEGYRKMGSSGVKLEKPDILIEHEARQLIWLKDDNESGKRSLFVTADSRLRRIIARDNELRSLSSFAISHLGLLALVEVIIGPNIDDRSAARLIWLSPPGDEREALYEYFVKLALHDYQEGMGMELEDIAEKLSREASEQLEKGRQTLFSKDPAEISRAARFIDEYQDKFFEHWRRAIEKHLRE